MEENPRGKGRPRLAVKSKKRSMTFPALLYERLEKIAARDGRSVSSLIVEAVSDLVRERERGPLVPVLREAA